MKITNKYGLPRVLVETIENDQYDSGRPAGCEKYVTITTLVRPPQLNQLAWEHGGEIEYDASDLIWALLGQGFHATRERLTDAGQVLCEERLYADIGGWTISSKIDCYDPREHGLYDYKVTKVYALSGDMKPEWFWQLQIGAWLLRRHGFCVETLGIIAILKDWSAMRARMESDYPSKGVQVMTADPIDDEQVECWIQDRLSELDVRVARPCSDEERWCRGGNWAAMKRGMKRARKLFNSRMECLEWIDRQNDRLELFVQERPKEFIRCEEYCPVAKWCPQLAQERDDRVQPADDSQLPF